MHVDAGDWRPPTALQWRKADPVAIAVGASVALGVHLLVFGSIGIAALLHSLGLLGPDEPEAPVQEREIVEAHFIPRGKILMPDQLPNRRVPRLSTAPPEPGTAVSKVQRPHRDRPDAGPRPENPTDDVLTRLGDRAQVFAEIAEERDQEGTPDGVEDAPPDTARAGDLYAGQLYIFFRRGWTVPTVVSDDERRALTAEVDVSIGGDRRITGYRIRGASGNALFDQSVLDRLQALQDAQAEVPEPPAEIADQYLGQTIGLRFRGRDAH